MSEYKCDDCGKSYNEQKKEDMQDIYNIVEDGFCRKCLKKYTN